MNIGILTGGRIPTPFASSFNVMKMAQGFASLGHHVEVVTAASLKISRWKKKILNIPSHYGLQQNIKITWLNPSVKAYITGSTSHDVLYCQRAAKYAEEKFDVAYCRSYLIPYYTAQAGLPTFIETHTINYDIPPLQKIYEAAHLDNFKGLVTIHEKIKHEHVRRGIPEEKVLVLEDGVDLQRFNIEDDPQVWRRHLGLKKNLFYAVYCGHLYKEKGIEIIIEAAKRLQGQKDLQFLLVGGLVKDRKYWQKYCQRAKIHNILFTGFVANSDVPKYLKAADCLLLPYKMDMNYEVMDINTTSPLKLFEYMAAKRAIIATNIPVVNKILRNGKNALLAEQWIDNFISKIIECKTNSQNRKKLGLNAGEDVKKFTWEKRCQKILNHL